jgi:hypothetical protein
MKNYNLFLDDYRIPEDCLEYKDDERYGTETWVIVKSHEAFVQELETRWEIGEFPKLVSFDHDLDGEHYDPSMWKGVEAYEHAYKEFTVPTGRRSAEFLVSFCREQNITLPECLIHTMNPAGHERIKTTLNIGVQQPE